MYIPLLGRLSFFEYPILVITFTLAWLEYIISTITTLLPSSVISLFTITTSNIYKLLNLTIVSKTHTKKYQYFDKNEQLEIDEDHYNRMKDLLEYDNITQMAQVFGYDIESHIVKTTDNYLLTLHRIMKNGKPNEGGKVIYLHHGLLMSSEIWLTMLNKSLNLPLILYELGYDVWLGNNRGNKYCQKHLFLSTKLEAFWNFSIDEFALFDIPSNINYILALTKQDDLTYVGFSQGTAQIFASLSINFELNSKIKKIIAISPATTPHGLYSKFLDIFLKTSPNIIYLLFSRKILMPSVDFWQKIMYPPLFNTSIEISNYLLFNWTNKNMSKLQKLCSYGHLYSTTSVKTVVHWFQIMKHKNFQMYSDSDLFSGYNRPLSYPLKNIKIPIYLIYGNADSLVDIEVMTNQLPKELTTCVEVDGHEHLDNLWGRDVDKVVFNHVLRFLNSDVRNNGTIKH